MRKDLFLLIKLALLLLIIIWIISTVNIKETGKIFVSANIHYVFFAFLLSNLSNIFLTIKWYRLSSPLKIKSTFLDLLSLNYISMFYSIFVPGQSSGELIKGLKLTKREGAFQKVWIPIFIDKITNLLIVLIIGFVAILFDKTFRKNTALIGFVALLTIVFSFFTLILFSERTNKIVGFFINILTKILKSFKKETGFLKDFSLSYFESYKKHDRLMLETIFWSFLTKLPHIFVFYFLALSLNISLDLIQSSWLFAIVSIATILPLSFSGLGVREGTVVVLLSQIGIPKHAALGLSMLIFTIGLASGLIGGIFEMFTGFHIVTHKANEQSNKRK